MPVETENYYRISEVADLLGGSQGAVRNAIHSGRLPSIVDRGIRMVLKADAHAYKIRTQGEAKEKPSGRPKGVKDSKPRKSRKKAGDA